jgi:hypothetical protein
MILYGTGYRSNSGVGHLCILGCTISLLGLAVCSFLCSNFKLSLLVCSFCLVGGIRFYLDVIEYRICLRLSTV